MSRSLGGEDEKVEVEGGVHEPERPHGAAVIKGKRRDLRAVASVGRVASAKHQAETGGTGRAGKGGGGGLDWGSISTFQPDKRRRDKRGERRSEESSIVTSTSQSEATSLHPRTLMR